LAKFIEGKYNHPDIINAFIKSLEGLNEYESTVCKIALLLIKHSDSTSKDSEAFLDLQIETFFSLPISERVVYILEQLLTSIRYKNFQKAKYIMRKIDHKLLDNSQKDLYFKSRLIVYLFFEDFGQSVELLKEFESDKKLTDLLYTFNGYLHINKVSSLNMIKEFNESDFIDEQKLNEIYERYKTAVEFIPEVIDIYKLLRKSVSFHVNIFLILRIWQFSKNTFRLLRLRLFANIH
jgi:hypothetical protein